MELAFAAVGVADVALRTSSKLWRLCEVWRDAPADIHLLRDEICRAREFFEEVARTIEDSQETFRLPADGTHYPKVWAAKSTEELTLLIGRGRDVLGSMEGLIAAVVDEDDDEPGSLLPPLATRRKALWLMKRRRAASLVKELKNVVMGICASLLNLNLWASLFSCL